MKWYESCMRKQRTKSKSWVFSSSNLNEPSLAFLLAYRLVGKQQRNLEHQVFLQRKKHLNLEQRFIYLHGKVSFH